MCIISCAAEFPHSINFIQSSDKLLSKFYIIICLNKLKIDENTNKKNQNKTSMAITCMGLSEIHGPLLGSPGPKPMYRLNPLS
jgi:hypothetical protein